MIWLDWLTSKGPLGSQTFCYSVISVGVSTLIFVICCCALMFYDMYCKTLFSDPKTYDLWG